MPKRVDPGVGREQVADAVIGEIAEHGPRSVTLARIAARSGLAIGSIRHYFGDTLREVMRFTLSALMQRAVRRATTMSDDPVVRITDVIAFAAPTCDQERRENIALVEYRVVARTDPEPAADIAAKRSCCTPWWRGSRIRDGRPCGRGGDRAPAARRLSTRRRGCRGPTERSSPKSTGCWPMGVHDPLVSREEFDQRPTQPSDEQGRHHEHR